MHEAAHVVVALHLGLKLLRVSIVDADGGATTSFDEAEFQTREPALCEKYIVMAFAGFAMERLRGYAVEWSNVEYGSDRRSVEMFQKNSRIDDANLPRLRAEAERLVATPLIRYAIYTAAIELRTWGWRTCSEWLVRDSLRRAPDQTLIRRLRRWDRKFRVDPLQSLIFLVGLRHR